MFETRPRLAAAAGLVTVAFVELIRTAWISDDAAITLRSALNLLNGYGATFNIDERVQAYTHPLWFLLISGASAVTGNVFVSTFALSIGISLAVLWLLVARVTTQLWAGALAASALICSKAYVDFSTSGLENPLSHLLIVVAVIAAVRACEPPVGSALTGFFVTCSLLYLSRPDLLVLIAPLSLLVIVRNRRSPRVLMRAVSIGALPAVAWTLFALYYYGFPFPNPAYAKLGAGVPLGERVIQGGRYLLDSLARDRLTVVFILGGIVIGVRSVAISRALGAGSVLYLAYVVGIGGDFMTGRFLTAPLLVAAVVLARSEISNRRLQVLACGVAALAVTSIDATLLSGSRYSDSTVDEETGIADERAYYFQRYGLIAAPDDTFVQPAWVIADRSVSVVCGNLGFTGIHQGPGAHLIDECALADPLLARLPAERTRKWRIGHFQRQLPTDYQESVEQRANLLFDPGTRTYYASIRRITRGNLNDVGRWREIVRMNLGQVPEPDWNMYHRYQGAALFTSSSRLMTVGRDGPPLAGSIPSSVRARFCRVFIVLFAAAGVWTVVVVLTGGFVLDVGAFRLRSRTATNPTIITVACGLIACALAASGRRREFLAGECSALVRGLARSLDPRQHTPTSLREGTGRVIAGVRRALTGIMLIAAAVVVALHAVAWCAGIVVVLKNLHLPPVQSAWALGSSGLMLLVVQRASRRQRVLATAAILVAFFACTVAFPLDLQFAGTGFMGDGADYAKDREKFERYNPAAGDNQTLPFKSHLGDALLAGVDALFGRTDTSPEVAYKLLSRLGGLLFVGELLVVLAVLRGSRRACRYIGLALAIPLVIGFFGYYEVGYMAVSAAAFPLLIRSLSARSHEPFLEVGAGIQGLHAAFHGFGLLGIAGGVAAALRARSRSLSAASRYTAFALAGYLSWILLYIVVLHWSVEADAHSAYIALRRVAESYYFDQRLVHPLLSWNGVAEIGMASLATGVPLLAVSLLRTKSRLERHLAALYALPGLAFLIIWWPSAGVNRDMDLLLGAFAGIGGAIWMSSRTPRTALLGWIVLVLVHVMLWAVVADRTVERIWSEL